MIHARVTLAAGVSAFVLALLACSSSGSGSPPGNADAGIDGATPQDGPGWLTCAEPFTLDPSGLGCRPIVATTCGMGQRPQLGTSTCVDVAADACAAGFTTDGWGCQAVLPATACTGATKETLGATACAAIDDCTVAFPPAGATLFVDAAGASDATHFTTVGAAITAAPAGATIAIAAGTYTEALTVTRSLSLVGRCAAQVIIASPGGNASGISATSGTVSLGHVTLSGHLSGANVSGGATFTLSDAVIDGSRASGLDVAGATVVVDGSVIRASAGDGIEAGVGSTVTVTNSALVGNTTIGIAMTGATSSLTLQGAAILSTQETASGFGLGIMIQDGAKGDISNTAISDNHEVGLLVYGAGTTASLTDSVVARTAASSATVYGRGVLVHSAVATLTRTTLVGNQESAIAAEEKGAATLNSCVTKNTVSSTDGSDGNGASVITEGSVSFVGSAIIDNAGAGIAATGAGATVSVKQSLVSGTKGDATGMRGFGIGMEMGSSATLSDVAFVENRDAGVASTDMGTIITADHVVVLRTQPGLGTTDGRGFDIELGATGTLTKSAILDNHDIGVQVRTGATLTFDELVVSGTLPQQSDGQHGRGLEADSGGIVNGQHATFDANHGVSVLAIAAGSAVTLSSLWIASTLADPSGAARALTAQTNASVVVDHAVLAQSAQVAVAATDSATVTLSQSIVDTTKMANGDFGHGVLAWQGSLATLSDVTIQSCAGSALVFDASRGTVYDGQVMSNAVGISVQDGSTLEQADTVPDDPGDGEVVVSSSTAFENNGARVGSGNLALPSPLGD